MVIEKIRNKIGIVAFCFLGCYFIIFSMTEALCETNHWKAFTPIQSSPTSYKVSVLKVSKSRIIFKINVPGAYITSIKSRQKNYYRMTVPGIGYTEDVGKPMLPEIVKLVAMPPSCTVSDIDVQVVSPEFITYKGYPICPVPKSIEKSSPEGMACFFDDYVKDSETYSINKFYPDDLVRVEKIGLIRDQKVMWLRMCPLQYNPVTEEIRAYHDFEVHVNLKDEQAFEGMGLGLLDEVSKQLFLNYEVSEGYSFHPSKNAGRVTYPTDLLNPNNSADYLIITTNDLITNASLDSLAHHRSWFNGFDVAVVRTNDIYQQFPDSSYDASIKDFLIYVYNHWQAPHFGDDHLGYVLLVGEGEQNNTNVLPTHIYPEEEYSGRPHESDFWYTTVNDDNGDGQIDDDDTVSDLIVGRFSVENDRELSTIAQKTIHYEHNLNTGETWRRRIALVSGFSQGEYETYVMPLYKDLFKLVNEQNHYQISQELIHSEMNPDFVRTSFTRAINDGTAIVNIQAHGSVDAWGDAHGWLLFNSSDVLSLKNGNELPIVLSFACNTARFFYPEKDCLGEFFLNEPNKGAIAFIGATNPEPLTTNTILNRIMFEDIMNSHNISLGVAFYLARILESSFINYILLGDPALSFANKSQHGLPDLSISSNDISMDWSPISGGLETITALIYNLGFTDAQNVVIKFFNGCPENGGQQIGEDQIIDHIKKCGGHESVHVLIDDVVEGEISVFVRIDPHQHIDEIEESNNTASFLFHEPIFLDIADIAGVADTSGGWYAAFGDYNEDGLLDIYIVNWSLPNVLYKNCGNGLFCDFSSLPGLADSSSSFSATFIDYDNDGKLDIFLQKNDRSVFFYRNKGDNIFTRRIALTREGVPLKDRVIGFLDYNNDGLLDMYCQKGYDEPNVLYRNNGDGVFTDITHNAGLDSAICQNATFGDYDNDGDIDIYVVTGYPHPNILYQNNGDGTFADATETAGLGCFGNQGSWAAFGDYDNDGNLDIFVPVWRGRPANTLYQNKGDGTFTDVAAAARLDAASVSGTGTFLDYNNDGFLDLYCSAQAGSFYRNNKDGTFSEDSLAFYPIRLSPRTGTAIGDYDNDGDIDLFKAVPLGLNSMPPANILYRNKGNDNNWLIVNTRGTQSNSFGIGARVRVVSGDLSQIRDVTCEVGYMLQTSLPVEFGLGKHIQIDTVEVRWPSGIVDVLTSVKVNTILTVKEGYGDISIPNSYQLSQNYPNPFNTSTTIGYAIRGNPNGSQTAILVIIRIYNILGQEVITLLNEPPKEAGYYSVRWDGKDRNGRQLASGVYLYQLKAEEFVKTKKLLLLR